MTRAVFPEQVRLVNTSIGDSPRLEVAIGEDVGISDSQSYTRSDLVEKLEERIRAEIFYRRGLAERNKSMVHLAFADGLQKILDEYGVGGK